MPKVFCSLWSVGMLLVLTTSLVSAQSYPEKVQAYAGVVETDKGEGVFALSSTARKDFYRLSASYWAGAIAEFRRRHKDLEIIAVASVANGSSNNPTMGLTIVTVPKR